MRNISILSVAFAVMLGACTTPTYTLQGPKGDVVHIGGENSGSLMGGVIGYNIQNHNDQELVKEYYNKGYKVITVEEH